MNRNGYMKLFKLFLCGYKPRNTQKMEPALRLVYEALLAMAED